jgi:Acetyltransferase (GNAT) family
MNRKEVYDRLLPAEIAYAHFNALRTTEHGHLPDIRRDTTEAFEYLLDPGRPTSLYYNRAIGRAAASLSGAALRSLPSGIVGLELTPTQLTAEVAAQLLELGFTPAYQLCYLGASPKSGISVEREVVRLDSSQADFFLDLLQLEGVDFPPDKRARKRSYYCTEQFQTYVVKAADGTVCGWSTMFVNGKVAYFGNSFTLPQFRQSGAHSALVAARLRAAAELGLEVAYTDVGHGSHSHYNCERRGFRMLTVNTIWAKRA